MHIPCRRRSPFGVILVALGFGTLVLGACSADLQRHTSTSLACDAALPKDCRNRLRSYSVLPSTHPARACVLPDSIDGKNTCLVSSSPAAQRARRLMTMAAFADAVGPLEETASGAYGDRESVRHLAEYELLIALNNLGDAGGANDLAILMTQAPHHSHAREAMASLATYVARCPTTRTLLALVPLEHTSVRHYSAAYIFVHNARGLVEMGKYDEARALFQEFEPQLAEPPSFVAQCMEYLEGRAQEHTATQVGQPCTCEGEPPRPSEACGCESQALRTPGQSSPCVCHVTGTSCTRDEVVLDLDGGTPSTSKVPCHPDGEAP